MSNIKVQYLGLNLANPVIVSSSGLTGTADKIAACEDAGAGACVIKSLFQEEIDSTVHSLQHSSHPEGADYAAALQTGFDLERYCTIIRNARERTGFPVIGSLNAFRHEWWVERLPQLEAAGAHAIELNLARLPSDADTDEAHIRRWYADAVREAAASVKIPIAVKISPYFTSIPLMVDELHKSGAAAVVLFNRLYQFDINIDDFALRSGPPFSTRADIGQTLRWISLLYGRTRMQLAASGGIHHGDDLIKVLLAGAQAGQLCSTLYKNGLAQIGTVITRLQQYMDQHHFSDISQLRGKVSQQRSSIPEDFERIQYIRSLTGSQD
ncbi:dihydroorotate dehydrogenase-like protein [Spirochaeta africana]|uniref:Dihydroorotate dehydrogenase n=1 Tax=Spirochaeta africana (strain ATCC 700263 / DSM 8902 / Z-7692) TaxID=889378 RepID=H9UGJ6_SPIAZ|nr:dihydroorotate dehydrogenase-like protein [Spirochaeta africana]AFG36639.1 dihydroorotate dehydrogenase [Spirochaeta africana DSM 8902]